MQPRGIALTASLCLVLLGCVACARKDSGVQPQAAEAKSSVDRTRILILQGKLNDSQGKHLTGVVGVLFAIYDQQQGGAPLWQEVQNVELNSRGRFKALVGSTKREGIPPEMFSQEKTKWIGMQVLLPGEVERPRMQLISTDDGLIADYVIPETPEKPGDQPLSAEAQEASSAAAESLQPEARSDQSAHSSRRSRARRGLHRPMTP